MRFLIEMDGPSFRTALLCVMLLRSQERRGWMSDDHPSQHPDPSYGATNSTLLFNARPASLAFDPTGDRCATPAARSLGAPI